MKLVYASKILVEKPEGKRPLRRHRSEDDIKMVLKKCGVGILTGSNCLWIESSGGLM
jgi:hypothetical protein